MAQAVRLATPAMAATDAIPVVIVAFRNPDDVNTCLHALGRLDPDPPIAVFVCENGGADAFSLLLATLTGDGGACDPDDVATQPTLPRFTRMARLRGRGVGRRRLAVQVGEARENLGYAGGVNAYLRELLARDGWPGAWILNPDTEPLPDALRRLVAHAAAHRVGMVGSRLVSPDEPDRDASRGLAWRRWRAATRVVGRSCPAGTELTPDEAAVIDAPSGASVYVTRDCLIRTGLMDERYFLYFEDLEWGLRAKRHGGIGHAQDSVVLHKFGTTIGSAISRRDHSELAVYLDFRNRILFVAHTFPIWLLWTASMEILEIAEYLRLRAWRNAMAAARGMGAGLLGRTGRPEHMLRTHHIRAGEGQYSEAPGRDRPPGLVVEAKRRIEIAGSLCAFVIAWTANRVRRLLGAPPRRQLTVLYYHAVRADRQPMFERQMRQLARFARVVPAGWDGDDMDHLSGAGIRDDRSTVAITFDDGFESVVDNAVPVLARYGFPCTIFVPAGWLGQPPGWVMENDADRAERVISAERLAGLPGALITIGSHSMSHPHLTTLPRASARQELARSGQVLAKLTGRTIDLFAFPYGDCDGTCIELCRAQGYRRVFTIAPGPVIPGTGAFACGRSPVSAADGRLEFFLKASGAYSWLPSIWGAKRSLLRALGLAKPARRVADL